MIAFLHRLFRRKPKPAPIAVDVFARTSGVEDWSQVGRYRNHALANEGAEMHASNVCFKTGRMVYFEFKYTPVYEPETTL